MNRKRNWLALFIMIIIVTANVYGILNITQPLDQSKDKKDGISGNNHIEDNYSICRPNNHIEDNYSVYSNQFRHFLSWELQTP
jgi:archaellum component FlaG (FlaF/FlaG flagellin family)